MFTQLPFALTPVAATIVVSNPTDPHWANVVLLCPFDYNHNDVKGGLIPSTSSTDLTGVGKFGNGVKFAGSNAFVRFAASNDFNFGTEPFTIDGWVSFPTTTPGNSYVFDFGLNGLHLQHMSGKFYLTSSGYDGADYALPVNQLLYFEVSRVGTTIRLFINGVAIITRALAANVALGGSSSVLTIGNYGGGGCSTTGVVIDNFRITKGVARNVANYAAPVVPASIAVRLWNFDSNYTDSKISDAPTTSSGVSLVAGKFGNGVLFAGNTANIKYAASNDFNFGTEPFTIAGWVKLNAAPGGYADMFDIGHTGLVLQRAPTGWCLFLNGSGLAVTEAPYVRGEWVHFEVSRLGAELMVFINGVKLLSYVISVSVNVGSNDILTVGNYSGNAVGISTGILDSLYIVKGVILHQTNFTPPTEPYTLSI
jgi:hypothetical protein